MDKIWRIPEYKFKLKHINNRCFVETEKVRFTGDAASCYLCYLEIIMGAARSCEIANKKYFNYNSIKEA